MGLYYVCGAVAALLFGSRGCVDLHQLAIVAAPVKLRANGVVVGLESIRAELEALVRAGGLRQLRHEIARAPYGPLTNLERQHHFVISLDADEHPRIADVVVVFVT